MKNPRKKITLKHHKPDTSKLNEIVSIVCDFYDFPKKLIHSKSRERYIVEKRQICFYFAKKYFAGKNTTYSLALIGQEIGGKNHATVLYSDKCVNDQLDINVNFRKEITQIESLLDSRFAKKDKTIYFDGYSVTYHYSQGMLIK